MRVKFLDQSGNEAGSIWVKFTDPMKYRIGYCMNRLIHFPENITECDTQTKVWTIQRDKTSVTLFCDDNEVVRYFYSGSQANSCAKQWNLTVAKIVFRGKNEVKSSVDDASDMFRAKPSRKTGQLSQ